MAELLIKIGAGANYEDGDCICAFSDRHIACVHAQMICHPRKAERNASGLLMTGSLTDHMMRQVFQYRFERLSATEVVRVDQESNRRDRFGPESMDVRRYVRRRKRRPNHLLFGEDGAEIWFGGRESFTTAVLQRVWTRIERDTPHRRNDSRNSLWPMGRLDIRSHLAIRTDTMTEKQVTDFTEPQYEVDGNGDFAWELLVDGEVVESKVTPTLDDTPDDRDGWRPVVAAKRRRNIPWRDLLADLSEDEAKVTDASHPVGHEISEPEGMRYTSKTQIPQQHTRINKKAERRRAMRR